MGQNSRQGSRMKDVTCAHQSTGSTVTWGIVVEVTFPGGRDVSEGKDPRGSWGWGASSCLAAGQGGRRASLHVHASRTVRLARVTFTLEVCVLPHTLGRWSFPHRARLMRVAVRRQQPRADTLRCCPVSPLESAFPGLVSGFGARRKDGASPTGERASL